MNPLSTQANYLPYRPPTARGTRRGSAQNTIPEQFPRLDFCITCRHCLDAHRQEHRPAQRSMVVRVCMSGSACSFRCTDPYQMIHHWRVYHNAPPSLVRTPETVALDEVIAGLTDLAVGLAGPSPQVPNTSSTGMATAPESREVEQN